MRSAAHAKHPDSWPSQAAFRWELPATGALLALTPVVPGTLAAAALHSFDWCYGEVRVPLAGCLISAVASNALDLPNVASLTKQPTPFRLSKTKATPAAKGM